MARTTISSARRIVIHNARVLSSIFRLFRGRLFFLSAFIRKSLP